MAKNRFGTRVKNTKDFNTLAHMRANPVEWRVPDLGIFVYTYMIAPKTAMERSRRTKILTTQTCPKPIFEIMQ